MNGNAWIIGIGMFAACWLSPAASVVRRASSGETKPAITGFIDEAEIVQRWGVVFFRGKAARHGSGIPPLPLPER